MSLSKSLKAAEHGSVYPTFASNLGGVPGFRPQGLADVGCAGDKGTDEGVHGQAQLGAKHSTPGAAPS